MEAWHALVWSVEHACVMFLYHRSTPSLSLSVLWCSCRLLSFNLLIALWWHNTDGQRWSGVKIQIGVLSYAIFSPSPVSDFTVILMYYSRLNSLQVFYLLLSFKLCLSFYLSFYYSPTFLSTPFCSSFWPPPVLFFDHSLYLAYLFIILCLCMWMFFACDFLCALLPPSFFSP